MHSNIKYALAIAGIALAAHAVADPNDDYRRRGNERLYEANVITVHAVMGPPEQRCWVESEQVPQEHRAGGLLAGALIGGVLGHQIGGGGGRDLATVGGAVAGAAVGSRIAANRSESRAVDVQHCETVRDEGRPSYWDVTYDFRGQQHHVQLTSPPGATILVNREGEPRT